MRSDGTASGPRRTARTAGALLALAALCAAAAVARDMNRLPGAAQRAAAQPGPQIPELKFREFYAMPIGPRGLQPTEKLIGLDGARVRMRGYMARADTPTPGVFVLSPLPVELGDEDEGLADDLPPAVVFVHWPEGGANTVPQVPGILELAGVLRVGPRDEPDGRVSQVRLEIEASDARALAGLSPAGAGVPRSSN